ncbi:MAG: hypothetical protein K0S37_1987 [Microbacterium sp.]|jgi:hypothetical protein|nr:hypothetical protein [Microbacterium sp.]
MLAPYFVVFGVSTAFVAVAGSRLNASKLVRWLFSILAIVLVSVFAGIRDYAVGGPDVMLYGNKVFNAMLMTPNLLEITGYADARGASGEVAYYFMNWIVARFTSDPHVYYTVLAAFCSTVILIAIMLLRDYGPPAVMWLTYMFTAYVEGFNLLRQSPSLALAVLGVALVIRSRPWLGLVVGSAGILFHNSAVVFLVMWAVARYLKTRKDHIGRSIWAVLLLSVLALSIAAPALEFLGGALGDSKYQEYLVEGARGGRAFGIDALYRAIPIAFGIWVLRATRAPRPPKRKVGSLGYQPQGSLLLKTARQPMIDVDTPARRAVIVVLVLLSLELVLLPVREISYPFYRLLAYFGYLRIIGYGLIVGAVPKHRFAAGLVAVAFSAAYFFLIIIDRNEAFYASAILDDWVKVR